MSQIRCLLIDDEPPAIQLLETFCGMIDQLSVVGTCNSAVKAFDMLKDIEVDLLFLDIQMPVLNGIDFIKSLKNPPSIIITTAHREYALDGFDLDVVDYLLKPISFDRFLKAVDRYRERMNYGKLQLAPKEEVSAHLFFNVNKTHHKVMVDEIIYIESLKDYTRIHTIKDNLVVKGNIGTISKLLPVDKFVRIHRSFAIALNHVVSYNQSEIEIGGQKLPIGMSYKDDVKGWFK